MRRHIRYDAASARNVMLAVFAATIARWLSRRASGCADWRIGAERSATSQDGGVSETWLSNGQ